MLLPHTLAVLPLVQGEHDAEQLESYQDAVDDIEIAVEQLEAHKRKQILEGGARLITGIAINHLVP